MDLVTGATGHIGNVLARMLLNDGRKVRTILLPGEDTRPIECLDIECVEGDITDLDSIVRSFEGVDSVYHLAGIVEIAPGKEGLMHRVNVGGTRNVIEACRMAGAGRLVYTGSIAALAVQKPDTLIDETIPFDPDNAISEYGKTKALACIEVQDAAAEGLDAVIVCPTGVFGPFDYRPSEMGQTFIDFAKGKMKAYIKGDFDFVDVRDVAIGHMRACERGKKGEAYILSGHHVSMAYLMQLLEEETCVKRPVKVPLPIARVVAGISGAYSRMTGRRVRLTKDTINTLNSRAFYSNGKASAELGYAPRETRDSVVDTLGWFRVEGML